MPIRLLLLHSKKTEMGALERYLRRDTREIKQIRNAQLLLETVLETALEMEDKFGVQMDLEAIYEQLPAAFDNLTKNIYHVNVFKDQMIHFTMAKMQQMMTQHNIVPMQPHPMFPMGGASFPLDPQSHTFNPYQQVVPQPSGLGMPTAVNFQQAQPASYGYYQQPSNIQDFFTANK